MPGFYMEGKYIMRRTQIWSSVPRGGSLFLRHPAWEGGAGGFFLELAGAPSLGWQRLRGSPRPEPGLCHVPG